MIFVDTNVFMYAVGRAHPLRSEATEFLARSVAERAPLCTSAEVLQELMHAYLPVGRLATLDAALALAVRSTLEIWAVEGDDVRVARELAADHRSLGARDLLHLASCRRRGITRIKTFDRGLASVLGE